MNSRDLHSEMTKRLVKGNYDEREAESISLLILDHFYNLSKVDILTNKNLETFDLHYSALEAALEGRPIQYILGTAHFYGLDFKVNPSVLIPRPETEELVDLIIKKNTKARPTIIDIGTGSGCIAISLARNIPDSTVFGYDISEDALLMASKNAELNDAKVGFLPINILSNGVELEEADIIVSNPPYVRNSEKNLMEDRVTKYEPATALFVSDEDPLIFYRQITHLARQSLSKDGSLYFEINEAFSKEVSECLQNGGFEEVQVIEDLRNKPRIVKGVLA